MADDPRAARDVAWSVIAVVAVVTAAASTSASHSVGSYLAAAGRPVGGLIALLVTIPIATSVFAFRRYRDAAASRKQLAAIASMDAVTGLPNRQALSGWLER
ncbi:MAG: hypothetical protein QOJ67_272, partial [Acidimicrobiaceae bacterium]